jgi:hypothetical protein
LAGIELFSGALLRRSVALQRQTAAHGDSAGISVLFPSLPNHIDATVIVAVVTVGMMQVAVDEIIDVVTVGYRFVPATGAVLMAGLMTGAVMIRCTSIRILRSHLDHVFLHQC